jgi:uncharacterized membrane protein YuzA (DUF378 family)
MLTADSNILGHIPFQWLVRVLDRTSSHLEHSAARGVRFTLVLVIVGGLNWGLVGTADLDLVAAIFGAGSALSRLVYAVVGLSAIYQIVPLLKAFQLDEPRAQAARRS